MSEDTTVRDEGRLALLEKRRQSMVGKQIDNARLQAGSPMYYYCHSCGVQTAVKPEGWYENPPPKNCPDCKPLVDEGLLVGDSYDDWLEARGEKAVPR